MAPHTASAPQRTRHWSRYAARFYHLVDVEGAPAVRKAILSVRPHVIGGLPIGLGVCNSMSLPRICAVPWVLACARRGHPPKEAAVVVRVFPKVKNKQGRQASCLLKSPKKFGDKILAIFRSKKGGLGGARFRPSSSVRVPKPESSESQKKTKSLKKMTRPTTAGAACRRAQRPATPAHAQAHTVNCQTLHGEKW